MNSIKPTKIPKDWRHRAYTYYVVTFKTYNQTRYLKSPYVGELGPITTSFEFRTKQDARYWMRYWMNNNEKFTSPNIIKIRGLSKTEAQMVRLMDL